MVQFLLNSLLELRSRVAARFLYIAGGLIITVIIAATLTHSSTTVLPSSKPLGSAGIYEYVNTLPGSWHFDTQRDANNYGLTADQCEMAFPGLYKEIDDVIARRRSKPITKAELSRDKWPAGTMRVLIWDQQIYVLETYEHTIRKSRAYTTLHSLNRALMAHSHSPDPLPNIEFLLSIEDWSTADDLPIWSYDRRAADKNTWLMPDFGFYAWPEPGVGTYSEVRRRMADIESQSPTFSDKIPQLVWRGAVTPAVAPTLRQHLLDATANQSWADVQVLDWQAEDEAHRNRIDIEDHCKYQYIQHTAGRAWSGRLKYVQNCRSVIVAHDLDWTQHHQHLLRAEGPEQNYVLVNREFTDLAEKMEHLIQHPEEAQRIAENSMRAFRDRYLTPAAEACYWRRLVRGWAEVSWEPEFYRNKEGERVEREKGKGTWRGVPFESFAIMRNLEWNVN